MNRCTPTIALLTGLALAPSAASRASVYTGNPVGLQLVVELPGETLQAAPAELDALVLEDCEGGLLFVPVGQAFDAAHEVGLDFPPGDWCGVTLQWGPIDLVGQNQAGPFVVQVFDPDTTVELDQESVELLHPGQVVEGQVSGEPRVWITPRS